MATTKQEIFNKVSKHLINQGELAVRDRKKPTICAYRTSDGLMCAVGCLIKDKHCTSGVLHSSESEDNLNFIGKLQKLHDSISLNDPEEFTRKIKIGLHTIAKENNLKVPDYV